ncbi:hypothetical protein L1887_58106 [Cichorium endivia]|nr:hypothetical protein L1887_58106 [Cichorium endivia]
MHCDCCPRSEVRRGRAGWTVGEWHALASRMDSELDHIGSATLLNSHLPHESCVRTPPTQARPLISLVLAPFQAKTLSVPLARPLERVLDRALTAALCTVDRFLPATSSPSQPYALRAKRKTD